MSLQVALQNALTGLTATQAQLQVISGNISNAQTPGYSAETLPQFSQTTPVGGSGTYTGTLQRLTDVALQGNILQQRTATSLSTTLSSFYQEIQGVLGQVGTGNTLADAYNNFSSAMQTLSTTPQDPVAETAAVSAGQQLAQKLNSLSSNVQTLRQNANSQIGTDVGNLNTALTTIAQLNANIAQLKALNLPTATLEDQRDQALNTVASLVGIKTYTTNDGTLVVMTTTGQNLVEGATAKQYGFTASGSVTATTPVSALTLDGADVTSATTGGQIGGLLQMRDTALPGLTAQLNQFTNNLFNQTTAPTLNTTNSGLGATNDAKHFFAAVDTGAGTDNASTVEVNPDLTNDPTLLFNAVAGPDPTIAQTLNAKLSNSVAFASAGGFAGLTTTLGDYVAQTTGQNANTAAAAKSNANDQTALLSQLTTQYSSETGVSLDAELTKLVVYQNAYSASAKVITTVQTMFDTLMNI